MDSIWLPATLVLGLGLPWAMLDAWWTRRRWRLDRERRRQTLAPPALAPAPATDPAAGSRSVSAAPASQAAEERTTGQWARADEAREQGLARADEARESDLPA